MKQKLFILFSIIFLSLILIESVLGETTTITIPNPLGETSDVHTLIDKILNFLLGIALVLTPIMIVYAGFLYITAAGNEEKIKTANKVLIWTLIGLAVVLIAKGVPALIKEFLGTSFVPLVFAQELNNTSSTMPEIPDTSNINIWVILDTALNWFFGITLAIAVIMLIYAGFTFITSDGNSAKLQTASKILIFALIGVAIALLAKGLPTLIQNFLEGKESSSSSINNNENNIAANDLIEQALEDLPDLGGSCLAGWVHNPDCQELEKCCSWLQGICDSAPQCGGGGGGGGKYVNLI